MSPSRKKVFISYCHDDRDLARDRLAACLEAGGVEPLLDVRCFHGGVTLPGQMDHWQDQAGKQILLISKAYLGRPNCRHELDRALAKDPGFARGLASGDPEILPVLIKDLDFGDLPPAIAAPNPLCFDLRDGPDLARYNGQWDQLLAQAGADLGANPSAWLAARDRVRALIRDGSSVNLLVKGRGAWRPLLADLASDHDPLGRLPDRDHEFDLQAYWTTSAIMAKIIEAPAGAAGDMLALNSYLANRAGRPGWVWFTHFQFVDGQGAKGWDADFIRNLTYLVKAGHLQVVFQSRAPLATILQAADPRFTPLSSLADLCPAVEL